MADEITSIVASREQIREKVMELGKRISEDYKGKDLLLIGVLKGGFMFMADLVREITIPVDLDFISVSSYGHGENSTGVVRIIKDVDENIEGKHLLFIEDIVDTGLTLRHLKELFHTRNPESIEICTAFDKPSRRVVQVDIRYKGIEIGDQFVVGYGLDYGGKYRNLPDLCVINAKG